MRRTKKISSTYFAVAIWMLVIEILDYGMVRSILKPLLTIILIIYIHNNTKSSLARNLVTFALIFSFVGDVLLLKPNHPNYFMVGLIAFLLAHISYISVFIINFKQQETYLPKKIIVTFVSLVLIFAILLYLFLFNHLGDMLIPVTVYMLIIITMVFSAIMRSINVGIKSFRCVLIGSFFFLASDSILAINKFAVHIAYSGFWIMLTYMLAQYLIIDGMREYLIKK